MKTVLIGGNPKGYPIPFHPETRSGSRLRHILSKNGLSCEIADMTANSNDKPTEEEITDLKNRYEGYQIIFLGRFVERELRPHFPEGVYLPHPASRRPQDLVKLERCLKSKLKETPE